MSNSGLSPVETEKIEFFYLRGYHSLWLLFPEDSIKIQFCNSSLQTQRIMNQKSSLFDGLKKFLSYNPQDLITEGPELFIEFNPEFHLQISETLSKVWATPFSLAATWGITVVFYSSAY